MVMEPLSRWMVLATSASPTPLPAIAPTSAGGGEAKLEHEAEGLLLREAISLFPRDAPSGDGGVHQLLRVDPASIVAYLDDDLGARIVGVNPDSAFRAACPAPCRSSGPSMPCATALRTS